MTKFSDLGLSPETVKSVASTGYDTPTPIQEQAIPVALAGRDVLGIAQTGTGKTAAFTLPMIDKLAAGRAKARMPRSLVLAPTRELADQVGQAFEKYAVGRGLSWALLIGGVSMGDQVTKLERGVDVLIATPGRLLDLFGRGKILLNGVQILVVDEADRMLDMGFIPDIEEIFKKTPPSKQTLFFSATMPPEITRLTKQFLKDPVRIEVARPATTADTIAQHIVRIPTSDPKAKRMALRALVGGADVRNGMVFCNRKTDVDIVAKSLRQHGFDAAPIHGDLDQSLRTKTLEAFRKGDLKLLVASDVAARGLDVPDVSHVFNFDVPYHADDYVHRIGRTGRAGRKGDTFMIVTPADEKNVDKVTKLIGMHPDEFKLDLDWKSAGRDERGGSSPDAKAVRGRASGRDSGRAPGRDVGRGGIRETSANAAPGPAQVDSASEAFVASGQPPDPDSPRAERARRRDRTPRQDRPTPETPSETRSGTSAAVDVPSQRDAESARSRSEPKPPREERSRSTPRPARAEKQDERGSGVIGFGDETPAFLRR